MGARRMGAMTATQTWEQLEPAHREALLGWVLGSYAPVAYAPRFPLLKTDTMTRAVNIISQHWKGATK